MLMYDQHGQPIHPPAAPISAIFFDVGMTLIHPAQPLTEFAHQFLARRGYRFEHAAVRAAMRAADHDHMARYHTPSDDWSSPQTIEALWLRYYHQVFTLLGVEDAGQEQARDLLAWYAQPAAWQPYPEVIAVLAQLQARGLQLGAVSDWSTSLTAILHAHRLSRYLDWALGSGNIGFCKPSAQFYRLALQRAGVPAHAVLHVGDSYYADVRGARTVGIRPVLLDRSHQHSRLDCPIIHTLSDLLDLDSVPRAAVGAARGISSSLPAES